MNSLVVVCCACYSLGENSCCDCVAESTEMEETKVIYYIDDEETPYLMKISQAPAEVQLKDFKAQLNRAYQKFFFKAVDDEIG